MGYVPAAWGSFGGALAAVAGALTGLLFVALSVKGTALTKSRPAMIAGNKKHAGYGPDGRRSLLPRRLRGSPELANVRRSGGPGAFSGFHRRSVALALPGQKC